jgi:YggT family protein
MGGSWQPVRVVSTILSTLLLLYTWVLIARIILDLIVGMSGGRGPSGTAMVRTYGILYDLTEPVLRPVRRLIPPLRVGVAALDLSPIIVFALIFVLQRLARELPF